MRVDQRNDHCDTWLCTVMFSRAFPRMYIASVDDSQCLRDGFAKLAFSDRCKSGTDTRRLFWSDQRHWRSPLYLYSLDTQCPARMGFRTKFVPRTVLVDFDVEKIVLNNTINFENVVYGHIENRGIWPIGYNITTNTLDIISECVQREAEACDSMQG